MKEHRAYPLGNRRFYWKRVKESFVSTRNSSESRVSFVKEFYTNAILVSTGKAMRFGWMTIDIGKQKTLCARRIESFRSSHLWEGLKMPSVLSLGEDFSSDGA